MKCRHRHRLHEGRLCDHFSRKRPRLQHRENGPFVKLPLEIIIKILSELDHKALKACSQVSKRLRNVIQESSVLQYHMQLSSLGYIDGPRELPHLQSSTVKRQALSDLEDSWSNLRPRGQTRLSPIKTLAHSMLVGGIWATCDAHGSEGPTISFTRLPSVLRDVEIQNRTIRLTTPPIEFAIDPIQDLLVVIEKSTAPEIAYRLHFRTMSQNAPHPQALKETIEYLLPGDFEEELHIKISGKLLLVLVTLYNNDDGEPEYTTLVAWDWQAGKFLASYDGGKRVISSFAHLTPSRLMLAEHFLYPDTLAKHDPHLRLAFFDLCENPDGNYHFLHAGSLLFPPMRCPDDWGERRVSKFDILSDSGPLIMHEPLDHPSPFHPCSTSRLFVISLSLTDDSDFGFTSYYNFDFCVPFAAILKAIPLPSGVVRSRYSTPKVDSHGIDAPPLRGSKKYVTPESALRALAAEQKGLNWVTWAQKEVSVMDTDGWVCAVFGMRCAVMEAIKGSDTQMTLVILDFSPFAVSVLNSGEDIEETEFSKELAGGSNLADTPEIFDIPADEVIDEEDLAPFIRTTRTVPRTSEVFMAMENLLFTRYNNEHDHLDVDVWTM